MNKHNISLARYCEIVDDDVKWKVLRIRMPKLIYMRTYTKLMAEFSVMFDDSDSSKLLDNTIILYDILNDAYNHIGLIIDCYRIGEPPSQEMFFFLRDNYGIQDLDIHVQIDFLIREQKRLIDRYDELKPKEEEEDQKPKRTFAEVIARVEGDGFIDRKSTSVYMFAAKYKDAIAIQKAYEDLKNKHHG